jgi:hypothetical protein
VFKGVVVWLVAWLGMAGVGASGATECDFQCPGDYVLFYVL